MERTLICCKENQDMPLDMICIDGECPLKGLLCHKCFIANPHSHMSSDIMQVSKFITNCEAAFNAAGDNITLNPENNKATAIKDDCKDTRKLVEDCKTKVQSIVKRLFDELDKRLANQYGDLVDEIEGPKHNLVNEIDTFRTCMNELQSGLLDDVTEVNTNVLRAWKLLQKNEKNQFSLISEDLMTKAGDNSEEKF